MSTKTTIIRIRVTEEEKLSWVARANHFHNGNLSKFIRSAVNKSRVRKKKGQG